MILKLRQRKVFGIDLYNIDKREEKLVGSKSEEEVPFFGMNNWDIILEILGRELYYGGTYGKIYRTRDSELEIFGRKSYYYDYDEVFYRDIYRTNRKLYYGEIYRNEYRYITRASKVVTNRDNYL
jgi:hypothetical protein